MAGMDKLAFVLTDDLETGSEEFPDGGGSEPGVLIPVEGEPAAMPPDFLLECAACGSEAVWDTDAMPPVGRPEVGNPVLWFCAACGAERRHTITDLYVVTDKLHHEICLATELDRETVDRIMAEVYRHRQRASEDEPTARLDPTEEAVEVAEAAGVSPEVLKQVSVAEASWMLRRGYIVEVSGEG
jgi:hypothetical protein